MHVLLVVTVMTCLPAIAANVLGMNFAAPIFDTGNRGFHVAVAAMLAFAAVSIAYMTGHRKRTPAMGRRPHARSHYPNRHQAPAVHVP